MVEAGHFIGGLSSSRSMRYSLGALGADSVRVGAPGPDSRNSRRVANRQFRSSNGAGDVAKGSRQPRLAKPGTMSSPQPKRLWQKCLRTGWESLSIREL